MATARQLFAVLVAACALVHPLASQANKQKASARKQAPLSPPDSIIEALQRDAETFFELWDTLWKRSQSSAWTASNGQKYAAPFRQGALRGLYQHCHAPGYVGNSETGNRLPGEYVPVRSATAFSVCPTWLLSNNAEYVRGLNADEAENTDAAINPSLKDSIRTARATLIRSFDRAQQMRPENSAITGQRVCLLVDQQQRDSAIAVARTCTGDAVFCPLLHGYAEARRANVRHASHLFDSAIAQMTNAERCGWRDIGNLLPDSARANYALLTCTPRLQLIAQYWWLADPLYADSINERRVEHDARAVRMMLQSALIRDERFFYQKKDFSPEAFTKLVIRYGWPTYLGWGGTQVDQSHNSWLRGFDSDTQPPYTTYEYSKGRLHTAPSLAALSSPLSVSDSSWDLSDPNLKDRAANWWPEEHMVRTRPLLTLPAYQIAMLRREHDILLASAHDVTATTFDALRARGVATLLVTPVPDTIFRLETMRVDHASTVRLRGRITSARTLFAVEISDSMPLGLDARTRVGIAPPITLRAMQPGEIALSDPIVLQMTPSNSAPLEPGEALLNQMLGSTTISLAVNSRVGVFFESYGVREGDPVSVSVTLRRIESLSVLRRLGTLLNVAGDPNGSVTITWKEPNLTQVTRTVGGTVPIQSRAISLDIAALTPGPYELVTGIKRGAQPEVTSTRRVTIVK